MNIGTNAMPQTLGSQVVAPAEVSAARRFYWSLRREFWESRSIYLAPLAVALLFLLGFAISTVHLPGEMRAAAALDPVKQQEAIAQPYDFAAALLMLSLMIVGAFYSLDGPVMRLGARHVPIPFSPPLEDLTVPTDRSVFEAARKLCGRS